MPTEKKGNEEGRVPKEWLGHGGLLNRNQDGKHGGVLSLPTLLTSISSPLAGNHSWMLHLWLSPTPFQCSRTLKCKLQIQPEEKLPPRACNCFQIWELTSKSKKAGLSKFSEKSLWGAKRMTLRNVFGSFLTPECFQGVNLGWSPIIAIHRLVRCQVLKCVAFLRVFLFLLFLQAYAKSKH